METNLVREILKAKGGQGKHCENPPRDFLSDVDCEKKRRLSFLKSARDEVKSGLKFQDWRSQKFSLFGSLIAQCGSCNGEWELVFKTILS